MPAVLYGIGGSHAKTQRVNANAVAQTAKTATDENVDILVNEE